jgi:disulfide bond formation protein DsbB
MSANCDVGFQYLFKVMPFFDALQKIFAGGAECAHVGVTFLYLSLAEWSLFAFIALTLLTLFQLSKQICRCWQ